MKKIFTLIAATMFSASLFAADHRPVVTVKSAKKYEVVIDGKSYFSNNSLVSISSLRTGQHSVKVFEMGKSILFKKSKKLVDASSFVMKGRDISISIDLRGQIKISEDRFAFDQNKGRDTDKGRGQQGGYDRNKHY